MKFAVLDFETTGFHPEEHEIIQVGLVLINNKQIVDRYTSFVKPEQSIPPLISKLTGISDEMVEDAPPLETVINEMLPLLQDHILVGHHISFDLAFLQSALEQCGYSRFDGMVLDTMTALRICFPGLAHLQLSMVCSALGIDHERPHQADSDAEVTAQIWLKCCERLEQLPLISIQRIAQLFERDAHVYDDDFSWFIQVIRQQREAQTGVGLETMKVFRQLYIQADDWVEDEALQDDSREKLTSSFSHFYAMIKERLQSELPDFELRPAQEQMIEEVFESLTHERHLLIEAGTGTGKSLGYLIPALFYGLHQQKKIIVSTHTIHLQEQIMERDIPLLQRIFPVPFRASILKGRNHYLCLRKFEHKINSRDFVNIKEDTITAAQMIVWLGETRDGDETEIHFGPRGKPFWQTVASDTNSCLHRACPWFKKCFFHRSRHAATISDVVITNHSMLLTDVKAEQRLLPPYDHLIIDEAHHFEDVAHQHLGMHLQYYSVVQTLTWLFTDSRSGLLPALQFHLRTSEDEIASAWSEQLDTVYPKLLQIKEEWDHLNDLLYRMVVKQSEPAVAMQEFGQVLRIHPASPPPGWDELLTIEENIHLQITDCVRILEKLLQEMKESETGYDVQSLLTDLGGALKDLTQHRDTLHFFMNMEDHGYVYWLETMPNDKRKSLHFYCVPMDVSEKLSRYFFAEKDSTVLTSATLTVNRSFKYATDSLGITSLLETDELKTAELPSPFNYREQVLVCIPHDFPKLKGMESESLFIDHLIHSLRDVALETKGRMLVLFTSYRMLKQVCESLKRELDPHGIQVLGQGVDSSNRSKLIHMFQQGTASVLLGTSSFWEGVDIPGDALSCLAIVRLPFQPPNHPLVEAKCELIKHQNGNPFMQLSVPQAVIRFKQGFGRLIRKANDRGIVIIYDTRVIDTFYGKHFLYSLPGPRIEQMPKERMVTRIQEWFSGGGEA